LDLAEESREKRAHFAEKIVASLLRGAYFDSFEHASRGDDDAGEDFGLGDHRGGGKDILERIAESLENGRACATGSRYRAVKSIDDPSIACSRSISRPCQKAGSLVTRRWHTGCDPTSS
jgi:hypothetical protein